MSLIDPRLSGAASLVFSSYVPGGGNSEQSRGAAMRADGSVVVLLGAGFRGADTTLGTNVGFGTSVLLEIEPDGALATTTEFGWGGQAGFGGPDLALTDDGSVVGREQPQHGR